ncbi:hypothetical protein GN956_G465 [Arapaima gigas]
MDDLDALLADLESTTFSHISKCPVFLPEETPYSCPTAGETGQEILDLPPATPLNGSSQDPLNSKHSSQQQSFGSAQKGSQSWGSSSPTPGHIEEDHVYSFPNKQKSSEAPGAMSSALGSNLSELDRLLLELNAVQQSTPSFPTTEETPPPLPSCGTTHYVQENGCPPAIKPALPTTEKAKHNGGRGIEDMRPSVKSLLDELESSVPTPISAPSAVQRELRDGHLDIPAEQQTRISASSATRELDELMACLSDFKPGSLGSLNSEPLPHQRANGPRLAFSPPAAPSDSFSTGPSPISAKQPACDSPVPAVSLELLHIEEEGVDIGGRTHSKISVDLPPDLQEPRFSGSQPPASKELDPATIIDVSASMLSSPLESLVVLSETTPGCTLPSADPPSSGSVSGESTSLPLDPSGPSVSKTLNSGVTFDSKDRRSQAVSSTKPSASPTITTIPGSHTSLDISSITSPSTPSTSAAESPISQSTSTSALFASTSKIPNSISTPATTSCPPPPLPAVKSSTPPPIPTFKLIPEPAPEGKGESLEDALDKLLAMSFSGLECPAESTSQEILQEVCEAAVLAIDRKEVQPDIYTAPSQRPEQQRDMIAAAEVRRCDVSEWADQWASEPCEGPDGTVSPITEASWTDDSPLSSPCPPGTPDAQLDLPLLQPSAVERVSASGHIKSVIRRTKETSNVHPMYREGHPRRKLGPIIFNKNSSQDRLIEELQGKLGISRAERRPRRHDDWLTEGVIVTSRPQRTREDGPGVEVDKIIIPPESPVPQRKVLPLTQSPPTHQSHSPVNEPKRLPSLKQALSSVHQAPPPVPPPPPPPPSPPLQLSISQPCLPRNHPITGKPPNPQKHPTTPYVHKAVGTLSSIPIAPPLSLPVQPARPPSPKVLVSIGIQTEEDPLFPPMQARDSAFLCPLYWIMAQGKGPGSPTGPPRPVNKLDNMLGSLQSDLNRLGVQTLAKGVCGACKKPIAGQVVTAMGRTWHPEHFVCTHCQEEIGSRNFFERDGQPYCEKDYHNLFSPRCFYCNGPILDKVVTALDRTWHPEHFFCAQCGAFFGPEGFHEKDGKAYCRKDYFDMFAPKCGGCARAILENYISALNCLWHPECFVCRECFTPFVNGSFFEHDGQPFCEAHYHERRGSLCSGCQKPITGRCITAMGKKFHPEHFVCAFCLKQLNKGTFKEQNDKPYCQSCFLKLFS